MRMREGPMTEGDQELSMEGVTMFLGMVAETVYELDRRFPEHGFREEFEGYLGWLRLRTTELSHPSELGARTLRDLRTLESAFRHFLEDVAIREDSDRDG